MSERQAIFLHGIELGVWFGGMAVYLVMLIKMAAARL